MSDNKDSTGYQPYKTDEEKRKAVTSDIPLEPIVNVTVTPDKDDFFRDNLINRLDQLIAIFGGIHEQIPKIVRGLEKIADSIGKKPLW